MASFLYTHYKKAALSGAVRLNVDTVKVMLVGSSYGPFVANNSAETTHISTGDITAYEIAAGGGYAKGGLELTNKSLAADTTDREGVFDADDVTWSNSTITASGAIIYISGYNSGEAVAADARNDNFAKSRSFLVAFVDFGGNQSSSNGTFRISWNSEGIINWT
jgi:hypothetical protein